MTLNIFNPASRKVEEFRPLDDEKVRIYVCGITPYDTTHLGHAFTYIFFDALVRYLDFKGFDVTYTQNVTDIDDDILRKSKEAGVDWREFGERWTSVYLRDMGRLNAIRPTHYVKATGSIKTMVRIISRLLENGFAYRSGGNVYFEVKKFPDYGKLSHFNRKQMELLLRERGGNPDDPNKRSGLDFILWQRQERGEPSWPTPFGRGRPGWHIECSAMINKYLGDQIDIHGGGRDLIFPHHESEIAQSESFTGRKPFVRHFMHTAMVMYMGEKMSKSLGNLVLVSDLLGKHSPNAIRWMLLSHHYRTIWEYDPEELDKGEAYAKKLDKAIAKTGRAGSGAADPSLLGRFTAVMDNDLDTPRALGMLGTLVDEGKDAATIRKIALTLGFVV